MSEKKYNILGSESFWCYANIEQQKELWELCKKNNIKVDEDMSPSDEVRRIAWYPECEDCGCTGFSSGKQITFKEFKQRIIEVGKTKQYRSEVFHNGRHIAIITENNVLIKGMFDSSFNPISKENIKVIYHAIIEQEAKEESNTER